MTQRKMDYERELLDPSLAELLREAYADDPALAPAPGRTERIMRVVQTSGRRSGLQMIWASFAWGAGATATAAVIIALILGMGQPRGKVVKQTDPNPTPQQEQWVKTPKKPLHNIIPIPENQAPVPPQTPDQEQRPSFTPLEERDPDEYAVRTPDKPKDNAPQPPKETPKDTNPAPSNDEIVVAAALYDVATTAYQYGDYETAYAAYEDSYETLPTPEAALGTGNVLMRMAQDTLEKGTSDI